MRRISIIVLVLTLGALIGGAREAKAYCVYNHTPVWMKVWGETCARCLETYVPPYNHRCCPGNKHGCRGHTWITYGTWKQEGWRWGEGKTINGLAYCGKQVEAHGWASIYTGDNNLGKPPFDYDGVKARLTRCTIKNKHGHLQWEGHPRDYSKVKDD